MTSDPVKPISNFETNTSSFRSRRKRGKGSRNKARKPLNLARPDVLAPTPERLAKGGIVQTEAGRYQASDRGLTAVRPTEDSLARLRRGRLSRDEVLAEHMYRVAETYQRLVHIAGLNGLSAQNLESSRGGSGDPAYMMPTSAASAGARQRLRNAWTIVGPQLMPVVHGILIEGRRVEEFGSDDYASLPAAQAAGKTKLCIALNQLVFARWA